MPSEQIRVIVAIGFKSALGLTVDPGSCREPASMQSRIRQLQHRPRHHCSPERLALQRCRIRAHGMSGFERFVPPTDDSGESSHIDNLR